MEAKKVILAVTGSIAAYKAAEAASRLTQWGAQVHAVLTASARRFITPLTFQTLNGTKAWTDDDLWENKPPIPHVTLAQDADLLAVVPATAQSIAKLSLGLSDDLLGLIALSAKCPLLIAPAMDAGMWEHPAVKEHASQLKKRGAIFVGPEQGRMASGLEGPGRLAAPEMIAGRIRYLLTRSGPLRGKRVVVTAGGTQEPLDPVRVLANRSSGKQGFAIAQAALDAGAEVMLIAGPTALPTPEGALRMDAATAHEMARGVLKQCRKADALVMAAAVADFRPARPSAAKIKKQAAPSSLELAPVPDILLTLSRRPGLRPKAVIGFAAETHDLVSNAAAKLKAKKLDLIVANAAGRAMGADDNEAAILAASGDAETLPRMPKQALAQRVIQRLAGLLN